MISNNDVKKIESAGARKFWVKAVKFYQKSGKKEGKKLLHETILCDFASWSVTGGFLSSGAFQGVILQSAIVPSATSKAQLQCIIWLFWEIVKFVCQILHIPIVNDLYETQCTWSLCNFFIDNGTMDNTLGVCIENATFRLITLLYLCSFVLSGIYSIRCIVAGTFKYLHFRWTPYTLVIDAIVSYHENSMATKYHDYVYFIWPSPWDHMTPLFLAIFTLFLGISCGITLVCGPMYGILPFCLSVFGSIRIFSFKKTAFSAFDKFMDKNLLVEVETETETETDTEVRSRNRSPRKTRAKASRSISRGRKGA
jgi:hypothetical protein